MKGTFKNKGTCSGKEVQTGKKRQKKAAGTAKKHSERDSSNKNQGEERGNYLEAAITPLPRMIAACSSQRTRSRNSAESL